jgi:hypothetical protein
VGFFWVETFLRAAFFLTIAIDWASGSPTPHGYNSPIMRVNSTR